MAIITTKQDDLRPLTVSGLETNSSNAVDSSGTLADDSSFGYNIIAQGSPEDIIFSDFTGDDIPTNGYITGIGISLKAADLLQQAAFSLYVSKNGTGGTYSTTPALVIQPVGSNAGSSTTIYSFGGVDTDWGVTWSGFTDLDDLAIKVRGYSTNTGTSTLFLLYGMRITIYYNYIDDSPIKIKSGNITIGSGKVSIK